MAITHEWTINKNLKTKSQDGNSGVVGTVKWYLKSTEQIGDDVWTVTTKNFTKLDTSNIQSFTAFEDLTEAQVLGWVKATIDADAANGKGVTCAEWESGHETVISTRKTEAESSIQLTASW